MRSAAPAAVEATGIAQFLSVLDLGREELLACLRLGAEFKAARNGRRPHARPLEGQHVALLFEKPSLRTRSTFQIAVRELGGDVIEPPQDVALGGRESIADVARNLERWVSTAVVRTFAQSRLKAFAAAASRLRVVNALSDEEHPCQALADALTLIEKFGTLRGRTVAFVGDGNNVATSLAQAVLLLGGSMRVASPASYQLRASTVETLRRLVARGATLLTTTDAEQAVAGADAVYTDVWASMGQEAEAAERRELFVPYRVDRRLMSRAAPHALFMHCLPAHRGDEVTDDVIDAPSSVVFDQAENRLHTQKALLAMLV